MNIRSILVLILLPLTLLSSTGVASAEEIVISVEGNGDGSSSEVKVEQKTETKVEQKNEANIENNVDVNSDTGNNNANNNTGGDVNIQTGDAHVESSVSNTNINHNAANNPPCNCEGDGTHIQVSENGSNSHTSVHSSNSGGSVVSQDNTANITNSISHQANTGKNSASGNNGNATIITGSIYSEGNVVNEDVNVNNADDSDPLRGDISIKISGNGAGSINVVAYENVKNNVYSAKNVANIYNNIEHDLNTGKNNAELNVGDVWIGTGDIVAVTEIINKGINVNDYTKTCDCEKPGNGDDVTPPVTPPNGPPHHNGESRDNGNGGKDGNGKGEVLGAANGDILPVTGSLTYLLFSLFALMLMITGWYLRFRSGLAPGAPILS